MTSPSGGSAGGGGDLGTARGKIVIDASEAKKGAQAAADAMDDIPKKVADTNTKATKEAQKFAKGFGLVVAGGIALAVNAAKDFDQALANVAAAGGKDAAGQMDAVREKALQLGADTKFSATEAATAMEALLKAGLSVTDVLNGGADAAVNLAAAESIDIPTAAEIAASAMTAFGLKAAELPGIANKISQAASATKMDVTDFAQAMNQAGAVSKLVGLNFDDMTLAITAMGKAGIVGSDAGTSLKTFLMNLQPQTKKQTTLMKELGIITKDGGNQFFDAAGHIKSMTDISEVLYQSLKKLTPAQKQQALETMFGSDAIRAAAIISEKGAAGMKQLTDEMNNQLSVADKAKVKQDTLAGSLEKMKGSVETAAIKIGTSLIPVIRSLAGFIEKIADWFASLPKPVQQAIAWFAIAAAGLVGLGLAIGTVIKAVKAFKVAWDILSTAMKGNPWILIATALIALTIIIIQNWDKIKKALSDAWDWIKKTAESVWGAITGFFQDIWDGITTGFTTAWNAVKDATLAVWNGIKTALVAAWQAIVAVVWPVLGPIVDLIKAIWGVIWAIISGTVTLIATILEGIWTRIVAGVTGAWQLISDFFTMIWNGILSAFHVIWDPVAQLFSDIWTVISNAAQVAWDAIAAILSAAWNNIKSALTSAWDGIKGAISNAWQSISGTVGNGIGEAKRKLGEFVDWLGGLASDAWNWLVDVGENMLRGLWNGILGALDWLKNKIVDAFNTVVDGVKDFFGISSPSKLFAEFGKFTIQGYIVGVEGMKRDLDKTVNAVMTVGAAGSLTAPAASAAPSAATVGQMAASSVLQAAPNLGGESKTIIIENMTVPIQSTLNPTDPVQFRQAMKTIKDGIRNLEGEY